MSTEKRRYTASPRRTFRTTRHAFEATRAHTPRTGRYTPGNAAQTPGNVAQVPRTWRRFHGHDAGSADVTQVLRMLTGTRERAPEPRPFRPASRGCRHAPRRVGRVKHSFSVLKPKERPPPAKSWRRDGGDVDS